MSVKNKLEHLKIDLSFAPKAVGSYLAYKISKNIVYISGQLPIKKDGSLVIGKIGENLTIDEGKKAAFLCGVNILAQLNLACNNNLEIVKNCLKINGYVNSTNIFTDQPIIINPVSELIVNVFGEKGKHARAAVGVNSLPLGSSVEVDAIFEIN